MTVASNGTGDAAVDKVHWSNNSVTHTHTHTTERESLSVCDDKKSLSETVSTI